MDEPSWIDAEIVHTIHRDSRDMYGGGDGILNGGALESALLRPQHLWHYTSPKPDIASLAASLAYGIVKAHAFVDGNKRTAWILCRLVLKQNGFFVHADEIESINAMLALASSDWTEEQFADWLRNHLAPVA